MENLPNDLVATILGWLAVPEQVRIGSSVFPVVFAGHGPINTVQNRLQALQGVPEFGLFQWEQLQARNCCLTLRLIRDNRPSCGHVHVDAQLPLEPTIPAVGTPGVFFRFMMDELRPNGGYCSLLLRRRGGGGGNNDGDNTATGHLEIKFDFARLRGYGNEVTVEDFGVPTEIQARRWLSLYVQFHWSAGKINLFVDGELVKSMDLNGRGWDGVHSILLRGYKHAPWEEHSQAWSHVYVERPTH